jgi:hypothetical protein
MRLVWGSRNFWDVAGKSFLFACLAVVVCVLPTEVVYCVTFCIISPRRNIPLDAELYFATQLLKTRKGSL